MTVKTRPSDAHRWSHCIGSSALVAKLEDEGKVVRSESPYMIEGSVAHQLAAECLIEDFDPRKLPNRMQDAALIFNLPNDYITQLIPQDMKTALHAYVDYVEAIDMRDMEVELEVKTRAGRGYIDVVGIEKDELLHVVDYKHGRGVVVSPVENDQMILYGDAALNHPCYKNAKRARLHISQPRASDAAGYSWTITVDELRNKAGELERKAEIAKITPPGDDLHPGDYCGFCPAQPLCPALMKRAQEVAATDFAIPAVELPRISELTPAQLLLILDNADIIEKWFGSVRVYAQSLIENGTKLGDWKIVQGRANRRYREGSEKKLLSYLRRKLKLKAKEFMTAPELLSVAQLEAVLKTRGVALDELQRFVEKPAGKPKLARGTDVRDALPPGHDFTVVPTTQSILE